MSEPEIPVARGGESTPPVHAGEDHESKRSVEQRFLDHFGLNEQPFGVTPDPRFLYLGPNHRQALAALNYGTESNRGFLTLIAPPGLGKTSLLFNYLEGLRNKARTVFLFQTDCDSRELMAYLLTDLGIDSAGKELPEMHSLLNQVLTEEMRLGRRFVLVIDEAQNLTEKVLESLRLLSNFETPWMKLMQIVLSGQPQLADRLAKPSMAQLQQRISFAIQIEPLSAKEVNAYVDHRLWVAGYKGEPLFSLGARTLLAERSEGVPRKINNLCFCAMSLGWATKQKVIDREMMRDVLAEMNRGPLPANTDSTPKFVNPPKQRIPRKQSVARDLRPAVLTVKEPPARGWLPKMVLAGAVLFALAWFGSRSEVRKHFEGLWRGASVVEKSSVVPAPASMSFDSAVPDGPGNISSAPNSEAPVDDKNAGVSQ